MECVENRSQALAESSAVSKNCQRCGSHGPNSRVPICALDRDFHRGRSERTIRRWVSDRKSTLLNSQSLAYLVCRLLLEKPKAIFDRARRALFWPPGFDVAGPYTTV